MYVNTNFTLELWPEAHQATSLRGWRDLRYPSWRVGDSGCRWPDRWPVDDLTLLGFTKSAEPSASLRSQNVVSPQPKAAARRCHAESCMKLPQSQGPFPIVYGIMVIHPKMRIYYKSKSLGFIIYAHLGIAIYIYTGWWFQPSWKIWVRQWEGWHPICGGIYIYILYHDASTLSPLPCDSHALFFGRPNQAPLRASASASPHSIRTRSCFTTSAWGFNELSYDGNDPDWMYGDWEWDDPWHASSLGIYDNLCGCWNMLK